MAVEREYITVNFPNGDQHILPRELIKDSPLLERLLEQSHDNNVMIQEIASEIFDELIHYLNDPRTVSEHAPIKEILAAAEQLQLSDATIKLKKLASKRFSSDNTITNTDSKSLDSSKKREV